MTDPLGNDVRVIADTGDVARRPEGVRTTSVPHAAAEEQDGLALRSEQKIENNHGVAIGALLLNIRRSVASRRLTPEYIEECLSVFAEPPGLGEALDVLRTRRIVVLVGRRGIGRHTAAVQLLSNLGQGNLREVQRDPGTLSIEELDHLDESTRWLLDMRDDEDTAPLFFGRALADLTERLEQANSHLVVVIREDLWEQVGSGGRRLEIRLTPPPAVEVIRKRLLSGFPEIHDPDVHRWITADEIEKNIHGLLPGTAAEWAETIREQHASALRQHAPKARICDLDDEMFSAVVANVIKAQKDWREDLLSWHKRDECVRRRYFLIAAALMENSATGDIYLASEAIAKALGDDEGKAPGLRGPGIIALANDIDAELVDGEFLRFNKPGYGDAVLEYFWADRVHQREPFVKWMAEFAVERGGELAGAVIDRIAAYVLRWSVRRRNLTSLESLVRSWVNHQDLFEAAVDLVTAAALDPSLGKIMREKMLSWARSERTEDQQLKPLVARASGGPLFEVYPTMMLYRLGCIANTPGTEGAAAVQEAIGTMWRTAHLRPRLIGEISRWCQSESLPRRMVGRNSFIAIAGLPDSASSIPVLLRPWLPSGSELQTVVHDGHGGRNRNEGPGWLMAGWRAILDERDASNEVCKLLATWMEAAVDSDLVYRLVAEILLGAVHGTDGVEFSARRKTFLTDLLYAWCPVSKESPERRRSLREQLLFELTVSDPEHNSLSRSVKGSAGDSSSASDLIRLNGITGQRADDYKDGDASSERSDTAALDA